MHDKMLRDFINDLSSMLRKLVDVKTLLNRTDDLWRIYFIYSTNYITKYSFQ